MRKTKLFLLTIFTLIAAMIFAACGGINNNPAKKLSEDNAMNLVDTYDITAFNRDFALKVAVGFPDGSGANEDSTIEAKFIRTDNLYNAYAKVVIAPMVREMLAGAVGAEPTSSLEIILSALLDAEGVGEAWVSDENLIFKAGELKGYIALPPEIAGANGFVLEDEFFNVGKILEMVFLGVGGEVDTVFKADGTIDWDLIITQTGLPSNEFKELVKIAPINDKGELQLSKLFKNFTTYELNYDKNVKKNIITASLNFDTFIAKFNALQVAMGGTVLTDADKEVFEIIEAQTIKFVLGKDFFESIEVIVDGQLIGLEEGTNLQAKIIVEFGKQIITFPNLLEDGWTNLGA